MFTLATQAKYWWPVKFKLPSKENPGELVESGFSVLFVFLPNDEFVAAQKEAQERNLSDREAVAKLVLDWRDVKDEQGDDLPFSVDRLVQALQVPRVLNALLEALAESRGGAYLGN